MRAKTVIPQPPGETTMQRLDAMVRTIFAAGRSSANEPLSHPISRKPRRRKSVK